MKPFQADGTFHPIATGTGLRRTAVRGAGVAIAGSAGNFALQIGSVMILARLLTPSDFGIVTMVTTFSLLLRSFGLNGFTELIMQREELTDSLASNLFWINVGIGTILTLAFASSGRLLALFYHNAAVVQVTEGMSLTIGIGCLGYIHTGLLRRAMHFRTTCNYQFRFAGTPSDCLYRLGARGLALLGAGMGQCDADSRRRNWCFVGLPMDTEQAGSRPGHGFRIEVRDECLFAFCFQLLDQQHRQPSRWLAVWRSGSWILQEGVRLVRSATNAVVGAVIRRGREYTQPGEPGSRTIPTLLSADDIGSGARRDGNRRGFCFSGRRISFDSFSGLAGRRLVESLPYSVRESGLCCCITPTGGFIFRSAAPRDGSAGV